jgi:hypothetical protein
MNNCLNCGTRYTPQNEQHKYCTQKCRVEAFHKRKTGVLTGVLTDRVTEYQTHSKTALNTIILAKDDYDELQSRVVQAESWNDTKDELIYQHKSTITHWQQMCEFWKSKYEELLKKNAEERLEQETKHRQELSNLKEELNSSKIFEKVASILQPR